MEVQMINHLKTVHYFHLEEKKINKKIKKGKILIL